jgi:RNA polymerase sigma-70 factor (ECF subfamily)
MRLRMLQVSGFPIGRASELMPEPEHLDSAICRRLQALDTESWGQFYLENRQLIRGVLAGHLGYTADVEDVTQQVFVTAYSLVMARKVELAGDESGLRAWLVAIAIRLAYTERRRTSRLDTRSEPYDSSRESLPPCDPVRAEVFQRARQVLLRLPDRLRTPWLLRHFERMSLEEIASSIGVSLATVKRRLANADARFRKLAQCDAVLREHLSDGGDA